MRAGSALAVLTIAMLIATAESAPGQTTWRASVDSAGAEGSSSSLRPAISADGRFVAQLRVTTF